MKGLRWILPLLHDPVNTLVSCVAMLRGRLVAAALVLVGAVYLLIGAWLGLSGYLEQVRALFVFGALFLIASPVPLHVLHASQGGARTRSRPEAS